METKTTKKVAGSKTSDQNKVCSLPHVPERKLEEFIDPNRLDLIRYNEKKWVNHTTLHYYFMENQAEWKGSEEQKKAVRGGFEKWKNLGLGLIFHEVDDPNEAEIRIGFERGGSWSYVGRDCIDLVSDSTKRTMNFGWDLTTPYGRDTALHEIGHSLGFPHEHQNPNGGIIWDEQAVYDYFGGSPNYWDRNKTYYNVIRKISSLDVEGSNWDKDSIMHYQFKAGLIINPEKYQREALEPLPGLSEVDVNEVKKFYPVQPEEKFKKLQPFQSQLIDIQPSEQIDFIIQPQMTKRYTIQTFGELDTVMVLFEKMNNESRYLDGDDDSGYDYNAQISTRLIKDRIYYLRIRLYYSNESGHGAVMMW